MGAGAATAAKPTRTPNGIRRLANLAKRPPPFDIDPAPPICIALLFRVV
jgi:hypothetical protein